MFWITRMAMALKKDATGKREIAFMALIIALGLSIFYVMGDADSGDKRKLIEWWIIIAAVLVAGAFGFEALTRLVEKKLDRDAAAAQQPDPMMGGYGQTYPQSGYADPNNQGGI